MSDKIGNKIKEIRLSLGLSQADFSSKIGVRQGYLSEIESGKKTPGSKVILSLKRSFPEINIDFIVGEGEMYQEDEKASYLNAHKKVEKDRLNGLRSVYPPAVFPPTGPTTKALGKAMYIENIIEGDDIYITAGAIAKPGDMVLTLGEGYSRLSRFKDGDPQPYAICTYLTRNLQQPAKPSQESEN
jgi:transcriptional regulator with XRE-family HTH domain